MLSKEELQGLTEAEKISKIAFHDIYAGKWIACCGGIVPECMMLQKEDGIWRPVMFDDAGDGIEYLMHCIEENAKNPACYDFFKPDLPYEIQISKGDPGDPLFRFFNVQPQFQVRNNQILSLFTSKCFCQNFSFTLRQVVSEHADVWRGWYWQLVDEKIPGIHDKCVRNEKTFPQDPAHPIYREEK